METSAIAALCAFGGAVFGALAASLSTFIAQKAETSRTRLVQEAETERARLAQEAETRRHLRAALLRAAEMSKHDADQQILSANQHLDMEKQLVNLPLTDYFIVALKFEEEFQNLDSMDDAGLQLFADRVDQTFTKLLMFRVKRIGDNRRLMQRFSQPSD